MAHPTWLARAKDRAKAVRRDVGALWIAARDPRTPWHAKATASCVVAYALSPLDPIPDVIPVIGRLDDLAIVPLGIALAVRMIPPALMAEFRAESAALAARPRSVVGAAVIVAIRLAASVSASVWLWRRL